MGSQFWQRFIQVCKTIKVIAQYHHTLCTSILMYMYWIRVNSDNRIIEVALYCESEKRMIIACHEWLPWGCTDLTCPIQKRGSQLNRGGLSSGRILHTRWPPYSLTILFHPYYYDFNKFNLVTCVYVRAPHHSDSFRYSTRKNERYWKAKRNTESLRKGLWPKAYYDNYCLSTVSRVCSMESH